jgi:predicted transcriptional regulator
VNSTDGFHDDVTTSIEDLAGDDTAGSSPPLSFTSYDDLLETVTPRTLELIEARRRDEPASIDETARVVDRDVKHTHEELGRLARLGIVYFEDDSQWKRPVVWFDELVLNHRLSHRGVRTNASSIGYWSGKRR